MDPILDPRQLAGPIATLAAAGSAVTVLTEVAKNYCSSRRFPPPLLAACIAGLFTAALVMSQYDGPTRRDAFPILLTWFGLFQLSIGVYHGAKLALGQATRDAAAAHLKAVHASYDRLLALKDRQLEEQKSMIQVVPMAPVETAPSEVGPPPRPDTVSDLNVTVRV